MRQPSQPRPLAFPTIDFLAALLLPRLSSSALASWGTAPSTKTILSLFLELSYGDCALLPAVDPPRAQHPAVVRAIHVATVRIRNHSGAHLVETQQLLSDGTLRRQGPRPLSEKMHPGETPEAAAAKLGMLQKEVDAHHNHPVLRMNRDRRYHDLGDVDGSAVQFEATETGESSQVVTLTTNDS